MINIENFTELSSAKKTPTRSYGKPRINFKTSKTGRVRMTLATAVRNHLLGTTKEFPEAIEVKILSDTPQKQLLIIPTDEPGENTFTVKKNKTDQYGVSFVPEFEITDGTLEVSLIDYKGTPAILFDENTVEVVEEDEESLVEEGEEPLIEEDEEVTFDED